MKNAAEFFARGRRYLRRVLYSILPVVQVKEITSLSQLKAKFRRIRVPVDTSSIRGWLMPDEERALYALGALAESPMLEIGSWLGRSAICLSQGILKSGLRKEFITCELNPTLANYRELPDGQIAFCYPPESDITMGNCPRELFENDIKPVVAHPDGVVGQLHANLRRFNADQLVQVVTGDFRSQLASRKFRFIFADTMHGPSEIRRNAPDLLKLLTDGSILACHDITPENKEELLRHFQFSESIQIDSLFIGVVKI